MVSVDGTIPKKVVYMDPHLKDIGVCPIYSETTVKYKHGLCAWPDGRMAGWRWEGHGGGGGKRHKEPSTFRGETTTHHFRCGRPKVSD